MKKYLFLTTLAIAALLTACNGKDNPDNNGGDEPGNNVTPTETVKVALEVTDIADNCATVKVYLTEGEFYGAKLVEAVNLEDVDIDYTNEAALSSYVKANGTDIELPYTNTLTDLYAQGVMFTAVIVYDSEGSVSSSDCCAYKVWSVNPWYDPEETRDLMDSYAYGPQNTYFIEQPASGLGHINIDVKARGDFSKVSEPKYYGLLSGSSERDDAKLCYLPNNVSEFEETPTNKVNDDYTIDVYCYSQAEGTGHWATVGIYDEDYNILWSFMIWRYLEGDEPGDVSFSDDIELLDRPLGAAYSNSLAEKKGTFDLSSFAFFQWGRKDPFPMSNALNSHFYTQTIDSNTGVATTITNPTTFGRRTDGGHWFNIDTDLNLWGGDLSGYESETYTDEKGSKTIYDPCPAGYRTPDKKILMILYEDAETWEVAYEDEENQPANAINTESPFYYSGESVLAYKLPDGTYDYFPYAGVIKGDGADDFSVQEEPASSNWSNTKRNTTGSFACLLWYTGHNLQRQYQYWGRGAMNVRCQKE